MKDEYYPMPKQWETLALAKIASLINQKRPNGEEEYQLVGEAVHLMLRARMWWVGLTFRMLSILLTECATTHEQATCDELLAGSLIAPEEQREYGFAVNYAAPEGWVIACSDSLPDAPPYAMAIARCEERLRECGFVPEDER